MWDQQIQDAAHLLRPARSGVAFTGAGISTPSGIPDFRSPHSGIWANVDPLAVASIFTFRHNPQAFYNWIYPIAELTTHALPNPAHHALAALESQGRLKAVITQNIDMLHTRAGSQTIHELHGHLREATCVNCFTVFSAEPIVHKFLNDRQVPYCPHCGGIIKPNVILFGEQLPAQTLLAAQDAARKCDVMIVIGSSLEVAPASEIPMLALRRGAKLIIVNLEPTHLDPLASVVIHGDAADILPRVLKLMEDAVHHGG
jgi:NAD-dependent deacetylase